MGAELEFCVLGPLEVRRGGDHVAIPSMRGALLALLLLRRGKTVGFEALIDALWGEDPPATARTSLQVHASKLRKELEAVGARDVLVTRGAGYALDVAPEAVDLERFLRATDEAGTIIADDPSRAEHLLDRAIGLWRGPILAGIDVPGIDIWDLDVFEERRIDAIILRLEAIVLQDRAAEAVAELDRLRATRPLDERVALLTARTWARVGRKPEALATLARLRKALSEELGMEPGPAVAELESAILRDDPSIGPAPVEEVQDRRSHRRMVTALVCRAGSGIGVDPEIAGAEHEATASAAREVAARFGGHVESASAGRVTVLFGLPDLHEDDAVRAVRAAWELRASVPSARLGVATMEALFETEDGDARAIGGPIDVATELARRAHHGEVLVSQETLRLTRASVGAEPTEVIALGDAGEGDAITAFRVHDVAAAGYARRLRAPLVGRADELDLLQRTQQRSVADDRVRLVTIVGPAGMGKSRLVEEFAALLPPAARTFTGRCLPYERGMTLWALAQIVRQVAGIHDDLGPKAARRKVASLFQGSADAGFLAAQMDVLLGLSDTPADPDELSWATRRCIESAAAKHPVVLVFEDLHWATDSFLDLVDYLATAIAAPVTIVATTRPELFERRGAWGLGSGGDRISLETLTPTATDELVIALLAGGGLDPRAHDRIVAAAQGNPLFIEELLSVLVDDGHLQMRNGRWEPLTDLATVPVPPTVRALMDARLDLLPARSRALLEAAAIVGREFTERDVGPIAIELDAVEITEALDDLTRRDLIVLERSTRADGRAYQFHHLLMRDATYGGTPKASRARDHERFARALRARAGERLAEVEELVGHHFATALDLRLELGAGDGDVHELRQLAATHLWAAGLRAAQRDDTQASADLLLSALASAPADLDERAMLAWHLSQALIALGRFGEAQRTIDAGLREAARSGEHAAAWRLRLARGEVGTWTDPDAYPAEQIADNARTAIEELTSLDDAVAVGCGYRVLGDAAFRAGSMEVAFDAYREGRSWAEAAGEAPGKPSWPVAGTIHGPVHVDLYIEEAERDIEGTSRPRPEALFRLALALAIADRGDEARAMIARARDRVNEVGGIYRAADGELHAGIALLQLGAIDEAEVALRASAEGLGSIGERNERSTALAMLAEAQIQQGAWERARASALLSADLTADDDPVSAMAWRAAMAKLHSRDGDHEAALPLAIEAVAIAAGTDLLQLTADVHARYADVLEAAGHHDDADVQLRRAIELYERKGSRSGVRIARLAASP